MGDLRTVRRQAFAQRASRSTADTIATPQATRFIDRRKALRDQPVHPLNVATDRGALAEAIAGRAPITAGSEIGCRQGAEGPAPRCDATIQAFKRTGRTPNANERADCEAAQVLGLARFQKAEFNLRWALRCGATTPYKGRAIPDIGEAR